MRRRSDGKALSLLPLGACLFSLPAAGCCYEYIRRRYKNLLFRKEDCGLHTGLLRQTLYFGFANALQQSSLCIGKILVQGAVNTLGVDGIAAYTATMRIEGIANSFGESGTQALSVFIAQNCGAGNDRRVQDGLRSGMKLQLCLGCVMAIFLFILAEPGARLFLSAKDTLALSESVRYLRWIAACVLFCFTGGVFVGYFGGIGRVNVPVAGTTLHITIRVVLSWLLAGKLGLGAVALATGIGWGCCVCYQLINYRRSA